jgi:hypothetical protein
MAGRLCDAIYEAVIAAGLSQAKCIPVYHILARYIIRLADGHEMKRDIGRYDLNDYYYGKGKLKDMMDGEFSIWRCVWDIIYRDGYSEEEMRASARFFDVDFEDVAFVMNNLLQFDFRCIQELHYNPRTTYKRYDLTKVLKLLRPRLRRLIMYKLRYLYEHDMSLTVDDYLREAEIHAYRGFQKYEGNCTSEDDLVNKMFSCANSYVQDHCKEAEATKRLHKNNTGGYELRVFSMDIGIGEDKTGTLHDTLPCYSTQQQMHFDEYLELIQRYCSPDVAAYVMDVIEGQSDVDPNDKQYYKKLRQKYDVTRAQVQEEVNFIVRRYVLKKDTV